MASKLSVYNGALLVLGERKLSSLSEDRAPRRRLDTVWDGGGVKKCLEAGFWNFAMQTVELTYSPSVSPAFGFQCAFDKPTDWVRTFMVSADGSFSRPLIGYEDQGAYWYADIETLYVRYVSDDNQFGGDLSLWTENFTTYVEHYFALKICKSTTNSNTDKTELEQTVRRLLNVARATDAMNETTRFPPEGSWSRARRGGSRTRDGGPTDRLIS